MKARWLLIFLVCLSVLFFLSCGYVTERTIKNTTLQIVRCFCSKTSVKNYKLVQDQVQNSTR